MVKKKPVKVKEISCPPHEHRLECHDYDAMHRNGFREAQENFLNKPKSAPEVVYRIPRIMLASWWCLLIAWALSQVGLHYSWPQPPVSVPYAVTVTKFKPEPINDDLVRENIKLRNALYEAKVDYRAMRDQGCRP
jgi:hypothetical protein